MAKKRWELLAALFKPWPLRIASAVGLCFTGVQIYDSVSNQFPDAKLPKLGAVLPHWAAVTVSILPWWGWLLVLQVMVVYALFEYVRVSIPDVAALARAAEQTVAGRLAQASAMAPLGEPKMNFNPVKNREIWKASTLAEVAAALDPNAKGARGTHTFSYIQTVIDAMRHGKLKYIKKPIDMYPGSYYAPSNDSEIKREDAIKWLETVLQFDVSELR